MADDERFARLGDFVREQRRTKSLSIRDLAVRCNTSVLYLSQVERGLDRRGPTPDVLESIAHALEVPSSTLRRLLDGGPPALKHRGG